MSTSCPVCGTPLHPDDEPLAAVAGYLVHAGHCAATLTAALAEGQGAPR